MGKQQKGRRRTVKKKNRPVKKVQEDKSVDSTTAELVSEGEEYLRGWQQQRQSPGATEWKFKVII